MPLLEDVKIAAEDYVERAEEELAEAARPPVPPQPLLQSRQQLTRLSPQPDRRVAVRAAPAPLIEAAQPLLDALANLPQTLLDADQITHLHAGLVREIASFQSVCLEARIPQEDIIIASYALCAALDEAACMTSWGGAIGEAAGVWAARLLAVQFHGDAEGGLKVFKILGVVFARARAHTDVLDLLHRILETGFMGIYRNALKGPRVLDEIRRQVEAKLTAVRRLQADEAQWVRANADPAAAQFSDPRRPYVEKRDWVAFAMLEIVPPLVAAVVVGWAAWYLFRGNLSS